MIWGFFLRWEGHVYLFSVGNSRDLSFTRDPRVQIYVPFGGQVKISFDLADFDLHWFVGLCYTREAFKLIIQQCSFGTALAD